MELSIGDMWNGWMVEELLGVGSFGKVYRLAKEEYGNRFESALKVIRIPQNDSELASVRSQGLDDESVRSYYKSFVSDISKEYALMYKLRGNSSIVSYEGHSVEEDEDGFGWTIYIRMELLKPLVAYMQEHSFSGTDVLHLGIDMCRALDACAKYDIIHRDIKPENVFVTEAGRFKLGDFGIARKMEETSGMSRKGTLGYMAPEVIRGEAYNQTADIYSLGIMLYRLLNNNRSPFLPPYPQKVTYEDKRKAHELRLSGAELPPPCNAAEELAAVILKASAYDPAERYSSAADMMAALKAQLEEDDIYNNTGVFPDAESSSEEIQPAPAAQSKGPDTKGRLRTRTGIIAAAAGIVALLLVFMMLKGGGDNTLQDVDWYGTVKDTSAPVIEIAENALGNAGKQDSQDPNLEASGNIVFPEYPGEIVTVSTSGQLSEAIDNASAGTVIRLQPGTYELGDMYVNTGGFKLEGTGKGDSKPLVRTRMTLNKPGVMLDNISLEADNSDIADISGECTPLFLQDLGYGWTYLRNTDMKVSGDFGDSNTWGLCADGRVCLENCTMEADNSDEEGFVAGAFFTQYVKAAGCTFRSGKYAYELHTSDTEHVGDEMIEALRTNNKLDAPEECFETIIDSNYEW